VSTLDEGRYLAINNALLTMTGYAREEVMGLTERDLHVYADRADFGRIRQHLATSGRKIPAPSSCGLGS
jgi:PAS domain S-box-containing protein